MQSCRLATGRSSGCRAAALPGEHGRTRGAGPAGSRAGWGRRPAPALPLLHAGCRSPGRAGRPRGWEAAVSLRLQARSHRRPEHLAELPPPWARPLPSSLPAAGTGAGRAGKLVGRATSSRAREGTASQAEVGTDRGPREAGGSR